MEEVPIPVCPEEELDNPNKKPEPEIKTPHISVSRTQYVLVDPKTGHIHAQGEIPTVAYVWAMERYSLGNPLNLEVRETKLLEIITLTNEEISKHLKRSIKTE